MDNSNSNYLGSVLTISLLLLCVIALFNFIVNPFSIMDLERIKGINDIKPESSHRIGVFKKYQPVYLQAQTILVGNSRVEMGLNPEHISFQNLQPVYNLGVPGPATRGQLSYAQNVVDNSNVKSIILSLDYRDFIDSQSRVHSEIPKLELSEISDKASALLSLDSVQASIMTLFNQRENSPNRFSNGFNPAIEYREVVRLEGQSVLFKHQLKALNSKLQGKRHDRHKIRREISILDEKITEWLSYNIDVMLFINPYHKDYYLTLEAHDLSSGFNSWRTNIAETFSDKVKFCDFTSLGYEKSEDRLIDNTLMYFWEPTHYKKELGDIMIPMILKGCS